MTSNRQDDDRPVRDLTPEEIDALRRETQRAMEVYRRLAAEDREKTKAKLLYLPQPERMTDGAAPGRGTYNPPSPYRVRTHQHADRANASPGESGE